MLIHLMGMMNRNCLVDFSTYLPCYFKCFLKLELWIFLSFDLWLNRSQRLKCFYTTHWNSLCVTTTTRKRWCKSNKLLCSLVLWNLSLKCQSYSTPHLYLLMNTRYLNNTFPYSGSWIWTRLSGTQLYHRSFNRIKVIL